MPSESIIILETYVKKISSSLELNLSIPYMYFESSIAVSDTPQPLIGVHYVNHFVFTPLTSRNSTPSTRLRFFEYTSAPFASSLRSDLFSLSSFDSVRFVHGYSEGTACGRRSLLFPVKLCL